MIIGNAARAWTALAAAFLLAGCAADAAPAGSGQVPPALAGTWSASSAKVDTTGVTAYLPDDPALLALRLHVTGDSLAMDGHTCTSPQIITETLPLRTLIEETYDASPDAMGVDSPDAPHPTHFITCGSGDIGPSYDRGSWISRISPDLIAMNWFDGVLLFLTR
ncbi:hypothetical protein [Skermanella pratensis]|uniref:hypothetical protein n=1 Tax=Skermanella pratensis TaxID=2233999 RepID=UPI00130170EB|nr:hypothetical protein [Skermanella pratensis]